MEVYLGIIAAGVGLVEAGEAIVGAVEAGEVDAARLCLEHGAEVDRAKDNAATPLLIACVRGHVDAARLCLDYGADVDWMMWNGCTLAARIFRRRVAAAPRPRRGYFSDESRRRRGR